MKKQYTIGEFASLNRITPRILRHYDHIGLLKPADILENGYRVYTSDQIEIVSKIRMYQDCQFSLSEIIDILSMKKDEKEIGELKLMELEMKVMKDLTSKDKLMKIINKSYQSTDNHYDISYTECSKQNLLCSKIWVTEEEIEDTIEQLYMNSQEDINGLLNVVLDFENAKYRVAAEVHNNIECEGYEIITREAGWYLSTFHYGEYYNIGKAYDKLLCYANEKGYKLSDSFIERYFVDSSNALYSSQYITQILVKLIP